MAKSNGFFEIFDNYPNIDMNSSTSIEDIMRIFHCHPEEAKNFIEESLAQQLIEPIKNNSQLGVLSYKQRYRITQKGFQEYIVCDDI